MKIYAKQLLTDCEGAQLCAGCSSRLAEGQEVLGQPGVKRQTPVTSAKGADQALTLAAPRQVTLALGEPAERAWGLGHTAPPTASTPGGGGSQACFLPPTALCRSSLPSAYLREV